MAAYRFTFSRRSLVNEVYEIEADSEEAARDAMSEGWYGEPVETEYIEWYDDDFDLDHTETLDPLVKMIENYEKDKSVDILEV
jgi:hypothetical protein